MSESPDWVKQTLVVQGVFIAANVILTVLGACNGSYAFASTAFALVTFHLIVFAVSDQTPKLDANTFLARYYNVPFMSRLQLLRDPPIFPHNMFYGLPPYRFMFVQHLGFDAAFLLQSAITSILVSPTLEFCLFVFVFAICTLASPILSLYSVRFGRYGFVGVWLVIIACLVMPFSLNWLQNLAQVPLVTSSIVLCNCTAEREQVFGIVPTSCLTPFVSAWTLKSVTSSFGRVTFADNPFGIRNISINSMQQLVAHIDVNNATRCEMANFDSLYVKLTCDRVGQAVLFSERTNVFFNPDNIACAHNQSLTFTSLLDEKNSQEWWPMPFVFLIVMFCIVAIVVVIYYIRALQIALLKYKLLFAERSDQ